MNGSGRAAPAGKEPRRPLRRHFALTGLDFVGIGYIGGILVAARGGCSAAAAVGGAISLAAAVSAGSGAAWATSARCARLALVALAMLVGAARFDALLPPPPAPSLRLPATPIPIEARLEARPRYVAGQWLMDVRVTGAERRDILGLAATLRAPGSAATPLKSGCSVRGQVIVSDRQPYRNEPVVWWMRSRAGFSVLFGRWVTGVAIDCSHRRVGPLATLLEGVLTAVETRIADALCPAVPEEARRPERDLLAALILGRKDRLESEEREVFKSIGAYHLLVVSGQHVSILCAALGLLFGRLNDGSLRYRVICVVQAAAMMGYAAMVGWEPSVARAAVGLCLHFIALACGYRPAAARSLWAALLLALFCDPCILFDLGAQLTYGATLALLVVVPMVDAHASRRSGDHDQRPVAGWACRWLRTTVATQVAVSAVTVPFLVLHLQRFSPGSVLSGVILGPLFAPTLVFGLAGGLAGAGWAGSALVGAAVLLARLSLALGHAADVWIGGYLVVGRPHLAVVATYGAAVGVILVCSPARRLARLAGAVSLLLAASWCASVGGAPPIPGAARPAAARGAAPAGFSMAAADVLRVDVLDVGNGDAILIMFPGGESWLLDGGGVPSGNPDIGGNIVVPYLFREGIRRLEGIIMSHPHRDHFLGLVPATRELRPRQAWLGTGADSADLEKLRRALAEVGAEISVLDQPPRYAAIDQGMNERSLILKIRYGRFSMLFPGDAEAGAEGGLLVYGPQLRATVLKAPHHGSRTSSTEPFLRAVAPEIVAISAGKDNRLGHPHDEMLARVAALRPAPTVLRTDVHGRIQFLTDGVRLCYNTIAGPAACSYLKADDASPRPS
ncbi:MAG: ComEC/Rec2 family competence protein [Candidatus Schekmanbacteria bacterium]|nr:ComEC/Rec2 family competence protein [Candidatus Schekmanbacteria bacterium]